MTKHRLHENAGFVCAREARLGGFIALYDREGGFDCDADDRWIVMHEPSSRHVSVRTRAEGRWLVQELAAETSAHEALAHADIFPTASDWDEPEVNDVVKDVDHGRTMIIVAVRPEAAPKVVVTQTAPGTPYSEVLYWEDLVRESDWEDKRPHTWRWGRRRRR